MPKLQEVQSFCQPFLIRQAVPRQAKLCCNCHGACRQPAGLLGCDATMMMVPGPRWRHSYLMNWMSSEICQPSGVVHALSPRFGSYRSPNAVSQVRFAFADSGANCKSVHVLRVKSAGTYMLPRSVHCTWCIHSQQRRSHSICHCTKLYADLRSTKQRYSGDLRRLCLSMTCCSTNV